MTFQHGASAYSNSLCRCEVCCKANTDRHLRRIHEKAQLAQQHGVDDGITHGTRTAYQYHHCRCEECKKANRTYMKGLRDRRKQGT